MYYNAGESDNFEDESGIVFRDLLLLALLGFAIMLVLIVPYINPVAKKAEDDIVPPGNVIVDIYWPDELNTDVDLWVQMPGDVPVGYSNKGGILANLLRDDLGHRHDAAERNYETTISRGLVAGEYVVNVHLYGNLSGVLPVPVKVVVSTKASHHESTKQILATEVSLHRRGEELTVFRFTLRPDGSLAPGSVHALFKPLRSRHSSMQ